MRLLVGLGNPGPAYAGHRHNVGRMAVEAIARRHRAEGWRKRHGGRLAGAEIAGERCLLFLPDCFMNDSGAPVAACLRFYKLAPEDLLVFHDELDLAAGKVKTKRGGGLAGHKGVESIARHLNSRAFQRVRIGIGHPGSKELVVAHVLGDFSAEERRWLDPLLDELAEALPLLLKGEDARFLERLSRLRQGREAGRSGLEREGSGPI